MDIFSDFLKHLDRELGRGRNKVRIRVIGRREGLSPQLVEDIKDAEARTSKNEGITALLCINYGGREEITDMVRKISSKVRDGIIKEEDIDEKLIAENMYSYDVPDPDILIRTSGEMRLSNFLPWGTSYTEFFFPSKYWPDFTKEDLDEIIRDFNKRNRRFGS